MRISDWSSDVCSSDLAHAMRYGGPGIAAAIDELRSRGCARVLVLPLYPQYSTTTTASVADVLEAIGRDAEAPALRMVEQYATDPGVIAALAASVRAHWPAHRSEEQTSELQSLMRISYAVFCLKKQKKQR